MQCKTARLPDISYTASYIDPLESYVKDYLDYPVGFRLASVEPTQVLQHEEVAE